MAQLDQIDREREEEEEFTGNSSNGNKPKGIFESSSEDQVSGVK